MTEPWKVRATVCPNGQVTIGKPQRDELCINPGDIVWFEIVKIIDGETGESKFEQGSFIESKVMEACK